MRVRKKRYQLPGRDTQAYRLLTWIAISGEFPAALVNRLPGGKSYKESMISKLKKEGLLRTYYKDGLRTYRLTAWAKNLLLEACPGRFSFYLMGNVETNQLKSEVIRRIRLCRMASAYLTVAGAGVSVFRDGKPEVFRSTGEIVFETADRPAFYSSREIKEIGAEAVKIHSTRLVGVILTGHNIFVTYNNRAAGIKWDYRAEMRAKVLMIRNFCEQGRGKGYPARAICGLLLGDGMEPLGQLLAEANSSAHCFFLLDGNYEHFYYLSNDRYGEEVLKLLCDRDKAEELDELLREGLAARNPGGLIENDATDEKGNPVLFGYFCDMPRMVRFVNALQLHGREGTMLCFDFQRAVLRRCFGEFVKLETISFEKFERRFYP